MLVQMGFINLSLISSLPKPVSKHFTVSQIDF